MRPQAPSGVHRHHSRRHSCGLRTGTAQCWGNNSYGHSCGLRTDGTAQCWGRNYSGETDAPSGAFTAITAGWPFVWAQNRRHRPMLGQQRLR